MERDEAVAVVDPHVLAVHGATSVRHDDARTLLGDERFARLLADPIRKHGPEPGYVYAWNVTDYIQYPDLRKDAAMTETMECPDCNGDGILYGGMPPSFLTCDRCDGAKQVTVAMREWIERGKSLKAERMTTGQTLRAFCIANSIDASVRSRRERGVIDPATPDVPCEWLIEPSVS